MQMKTRAKCQCISNRMTKIKKTDKIICDKEVEQLKLNALLLEMVKPFWKTV